ncbi:MAG: class I SAM-dependent DNA methyltransferase [Chlorobi bacterium]|nr:class I SAM-dependent DNA methyltransferase [Chlorobiota bacterium]
MNKQQAREIIRKTFEKSFDKTRFINFIKNFLNSIDESKAFHARGDVKEMFRTVIKTYERIGTYNSPKGKKIDIIIAYLQKGYSLDHARSTQRNFAGRYLVDRGEKDAGLFAFVSPGEDDWRFSLVKMEYKFDKKGKVKEEFTPARRQSFLVGFNEKSHTAQSRLEGILADDEQSPTLEKIEKAFDIEIVTKEFFLKYRELFLRTKEELDRVVENNQKVKDDFEIKGVDTVNFAKKLLGQIIFLYFLQKKGWFGVGRDDAWGTGSKQFLRELFNKKHGDYENFFNDILEPLFYEALRTGEDRKHEDYYFSQFNCKIPFLNGGLFDPIGNYDWVHTDILLPNKLFSNNNKTKEDDIGDGILDIFDRYNFTVREDEPLEKEVAIDPELLGKAYEKFNAIRPDNYNEFKKALKSGKKGEENKFNKKFGVYYTPREIVHYMCQQSLINYLATEMDSKVSKESIEFLILKGEKYIEYLKTAKQKNENKHDYKGSYKENQYFKEVKKYAIEIDQLLLDVTVCDPAVGSGAFPVGMMTEIVKARNFFVETEYLDTTYINKYNEKINRILYCFKRDCIEHSLYGVDIDPGAVEIAKLRLWLSLMVDEEDIKNIKPLPNLDYKMVCGNSLLGVEKNLLNYELFNKLEKLKPLFFNETNPTKKREYKNQIEELISKITNGHKEFDFKVYFSEVFHQKASSEHSRRGGFDVVIANPPYVRADSGPEYLAFRKKIKDLKTFKTLYEKWDLMVPFIERGLNIANTKGNLIYIVSNAICTSKYAFKILDLVQEKCFPRSIDYFEEMEIFEAGVIPVVLHIDKTEADDKTTKIIRRYSFENIVNKTEIPTDEFKSLGRDAFRKEYNPIGLKARTVNLGDICYLSVGMVINADEKTAKGKFTKNDLISETKTKIHSRMYVEGKDIGSYNIKQHKYLEWGTKRVPEQLRRQTFPELYDRPKIMRGRVTGGVYDETGLLCNDSIVVFVRFADLHNINNKSIQTSIKKFNRLLRPQLETISEKFDLKYLLAVLNSSFALKYLNNIRRHRLKNYFYPDDFRNLPIADSSPREQEPFIDLIDQILAITTSENHLDRSQKQAYVKALEAEIDQLVYQLYDLTSDEIAIIEGENK